MIEDLSSRMQDVVNLEEEADYFRSTVQIEDDRGMLPSTLVESKWHTRLDPLWELDWNQSVNLRWSQMGVTTVGFRSNGLGMLTAKRGIVPAPVVVSDFELYQRSSIAVMAVLLEFDMMDTEQVAVMTGIGRSRVVRSLHNLYAAGLLQRTTVRSKLDSSCSTDVWVPDLGTGQMDEWLVGLEPWQYQLMAGGLPLERKGRTRSLSGLRHNLTTMEMMCKSLELSPAVIGAWGERHCTGEAYDSSARFPGEFYRANIGDGAVVTKSGKIIIFETSGTKLKGGRWTAAQNGEKVLSQLAQKAGAWTAVCGRSDADVHVVFLDVAQKHSYPRLRQAVAAGVKNEAGKYLVDKRMRERGARKIHVADSRLWFPTSRSVSEEFTVFSAVNSGEQVYDGRVKMVPVITPDDNVWNLDSPLVTNTLLSLHNPEWATGLITPRDAGYKLGGFQKGVAPVTAGRRRR